MDNTEALILRNLIFNDEFSRKVIPYIKEEYFHNKTENEIFKGISEFILKYNNCPTIETLEIGFSNKKINPEIQTEIDAFLEWSAENKENTSDAKWLLDETEKFCRDKAVYNAVLESISILEDKKGTKDKGVIPELLSEALAIGFNTNLGHDYFEDAEARWEYYHKIENKIAFDLEYFNKITKGGIPKKTLNCIIAGVNVGKSLIMCHLAASYIAQGKKVLYITLEMSEEEIAKRIDANLYNMDLDDIVDLPKNLYMKRMAKIREKVTGSLKIEEFPTGGASALHFKTLLRELALKSHFVPDVVFVDYINICASSRIKHNGNTNTWVKSISEELRGLAVEMDVLMWTATQLTRGGFSDSNPDMDDTAESFGLTGTLDFMIAAITNEELEELGQYLMKQLKNRFGDKSKNRRFIVGVDRAKQKLFDVEESAQDINDSGKEDEPDVPLMDLTEYGTRFTNDTKPKSKFNSLRVE